MLTFRRYVALAQSRGGAARRGVFALVLRCRIMLFLFIFALAKTVTPGGSAPRQRGQPYRQTVQICRGGFKVVVAWKPIAYTELFRPVNYYSIITFLSFGYLTENLTISSFTSLDLSSKSHSTLPVLTFSLPPEISMVSTWISFVVVTGI